MTEEIIIDKEDKTKKYRNNEIDCLHFSCRKGEGGKVLLWCDFYDDHCDNYTGCYYRKYLRLGQENENLKKEVKQIGSDFIKKGDYARELEKENKELKEEKLYRGIDRQFIEDANDRLYFEAENYRSALETIQRMILSAWEQGKYLDGGLYNDLTNEFAKINEVLQ